MSFSRTLSGCLQRLPSQSHRHPKAARGRFPSCYEKLPIRTPKPHEAAPNPSGWTQVAVAVDRLFLLLLHKEPASRAELGWARKGTRTAWLLTLMASHSDGFSQASPATTPLPMLVAAQSQQPGSRSAAPGVPGASGLAASLCSPQGSGSPGQRQLSLSSQRWCIPLTPGQVLALPRMGAPQGAGSDALQERSSHEPTRPATGRRAGNALACAGNVLARLGTQWPGLAPCKHMVFLTPHPSPICARQQWVLLFAEGSRALFSPSNISGLFSGVSRWVCHRHFPRLEQVPRFVCPEEEGRCAGQEVPGGRRASQSRWGKHIPSSTPCCTQERAQLLTGSHGMQVSALP